MANENQNFEVYKMLDMLSVDLLLLTRTVNIYPSGHPVVGRMAKRLADWAGNSKDKSGIDIGVTGSELSVDGEFYGGDDTRLEMLAKRLHRKNIARINWNADVTDEEVYSFARLLADQGLKGQDLVTAMAGAGIKNIGLIPLNIGALHDRMRVADINVEVVEDKTRKKQVWRWLHEMAGTPQDLARNLARDAFWKDAFTGDEKAQGEFIYLLSNVGTMIDNAIQTLPPEAYSEVLERLSEIGQKLPPTQIAQLIDTYMTEGSTSELALSNILRKANGERLAAILGGMVALGGDREERVATFISRFIPQNSMDGLTGLIGEWKTFKEKNGLGSDIWQWLEAFLLDVDDSRFMSGGYKMTLDRMAEKLKVAGGHAIAFGFYEDAEIHVDQLCASLVLLKSEKGEEILGKRITERMAILDGRSLIKFLDMIDAMVPQIFAERADIFEKIFLDLVGNVKDLSQDSRKSIFRFAQRHEDQAIGIILRALTSETRISARRFLVEILGQMPRTVLPRVVQSAKNAPWYYVRNIAIAVGLLGDPRATPFLKSLLASKNAKVRKEVLRSLARIGDATSRAALKEYADRTDVPGDEATMAGTLLERTVEA